MKHLHQFMKLVVLGAVLILALVSALSGLSLIMVKDYAYKGKWYADLSTRMLIKSQGDRLREDQKEVLIDKAEMVMHNALMNSPYDPLLWVRMAYLMPRIEETAHASRHNIADETNASLDIAVALKPDLGREIGKLRARLVKPAKIEPEAAP